MEGFGVWFIFLLFGSISCAYGGVCFLDRPVRKLRAIILFLIGIISFLLTAFSLD